MGVDLRLSGLASGFDWKPVVEQLIELERIPQKRLAQEQDANNTKISELGILKSQLETLLGRPVDLVELAAMPDSRLKRLISREAVSVFAAAS